MSDIHNPHDKFFKKMLSVPGAAEEFIRLSVPAKILRMIDLKTLEITDQNLLTEKMDDLFMDLIFECQLKKEFGRHDLYISILVEHKSNPEKYISIQIGRYLFERYQKQLDLNIKPLRPIIPLLYYHGEKDWEPKELNQLFEQEFLDIQSYLPNFSFLFHDIKKTSDNNIRQLNHTMLAQGLMMQKYFKNMEMLSHIGVEVLKTLADVDEKLNLKTSYFVYLSVLFEKEKPKLMKLIDQLPDEKKIESMHFVEELEYRARLNERQKLTDQAIRKMFQKNMEVDTICEIMDVSEDYVLKIQEKIKEI